MVNEKILARLDELISAKKEYLRVIDDKSIFSVIEFGYDFQLSTVDGEMFKAIAKAVGQATGNKVYNRFEDSEYYHWAISYKGATIIWLEPKERVVDKVEESEEEE